MKIDKKKLTERENKPGGTFSFKTGASSLRWKSLFIVERKLLKVSRTLYLVVERKLLLSKQNSIPSR